MLLPRRSPGRGGPVECFNKAEELEFCHASLRQPPSFLHCGGRFHPPYGWLWLRRRFFSSRFSPACVCQRSCVLPLKPGPEGYALFISGYGCGRLSRPLRNWNPAPGKGGGTGRSSPPQICVISSTAPPRSGNGLLRRYFCFIRRINGPNRACRPGSASTLLARVRSHSAAARSA